MAWESPGIGRSVRYLIGKHLYRYLYRYLSINFRVQPIYLGSFDFELAVEYSGPSRGSTFFGIFKVPDPVAPRPIMGSENWNFLKLLKTIIVGALWFCLGLLSIRILCFLKLRVASKNDPNLTITLSNFNIF